MLESNEKSPKPEGQINRPTHSVLHNKTNRDSEVATSRKAPYWLPCRVVVNNCPDYCHFFLSAQRRILHEQIAEAGHDSSFIQSVNRLLVITCILVITYQKCTRFLMNELPGRKQICLKTLGNRSMVIQYVIVNGFTRDSYVSNRLQVIKVENHVLPNFDAIQEINFPLDESGTVKFMPYIMEHFCVDQFTKYGYELPLRQNSILLKMNYPTHGFPVFSKVIAVRGYYQIDPFYASH